MKAKVLLVGGAGYLGGAVTDLLLKQAPPFEVIVFDALLYDRVYLKDIPFVLGDVRDQALLKRYLDQVDSVVWLAAIVGDQACRVNPRLTREVNCDAVRFLVDHFGGKIIYISTCSVYGAQDGLLTEESPAAPLSLYASTKLEAEKILSAARGPVTIFRLGTLFGVSGTRPRLDLVVNVMTTKAVREGLITVYGGDQYRPILATYDAAHMIWKALAVEASGVYNLCLENIKILDLAYRIAQQLGSVEVRVLPEVTDPRSYQVSADKAREVLGFKPSYDLTWGINRLAELAQRIKDPSDPWFSNAAFLEALYGEA